ncbi:MAG: hypothetical protein ACM31G_07110 [Flavobacteriales bacterium]
MGAIKLDNDTFNAFADILKQRGLIVVPQNEFENKAWYNKRSNLLRKKWLTPYEIAKFELLDTKPTLKTIKNMITEGRILKHETYIDESGKIPKVMVSRQAIERLNNK